MDNPNDILRNDGTGPYPHGDSTGQVYQGARSIGVMPWLIAPRLMLANWRNDGASQTIAGHLSQVANAAVARGGDISPDGGHLGVDLGLQLPTIGGR